ncbi:MULTISPECIES: permease [unclassified Fusibacter]|uniref:permease n=1 Tax=unclassified Fusibacter TaxID=2624464 RepID=UPI0010114E9A|nr:MULTISPECIES: permease [unclassified Fusibacter]MCK8058611.1 permease [Fusibacter sp. A2]NPE22619.1 permease [Fusibacter sp. A1]RXV60183.1 permease [Fusibacter sp. A1]
MDILTILFWVITGSWMIWSLFKDKKKTLGTMKKTKAKMGSMMGEIVAIIFLIGLVLAWIPPEQIEKVLGASTGYLSTVLAALIGSITLIPAFVAFPLVGSLVDSGASIVPAVAFLTTLTMVGVMTFPIEKKAFGLKFTLIRNGFSFVAALVIAFAMGVIL